MGIASAHCQRCASPLLTPLPYGSTTNYGRKVRLQTHYRPGLAKALAVRVFGNRMVCVTVSSAHIRPCKALVHPSFGVLRVSGPRELGGLVEEGAHLAPQEAILLERERK